MCDSSDSSLSGPVGSGGASGEVSKLSKALSVKLAWDQSSVKRNIR